jgi:hypothetical protein
MCPETRNLVNGQCVVARKRRKVISVTTQEDKQEIADLKQLNTELTRNIQRCRDLLADCRAKLAANGNLPETSATEGEADAR